MKRNPILSLLFAHSYNTHTMIFETAVWVVMSEQIIRETHLKQILLYIKLAVNNKKMPYQGFINFNTKLLFYVMPRSHIDKDHSNPKYSCMTISEIRMQKE